MNWSYSPNIGRRRHLRVTFANWPVTRRSLGCEIMHTTRWVPCWAIDISFWSYHLMVVFAKAY